MLFSEKLVGIFSIPIKLFCRFFLTKKNRLSSYINVIKPDKICWKLGLLFKWNTLYK
jgi:hypothetical protein